MVTLDIFCQVIDNFGDIGVVYRLGNELKKKLELEGNMCEIRVILDRTEELTKLNKNSSNIPFQVLGVISFLTYEYLETIKSDFVPNNIIIESFGCSIPQWYLDRAYDSSSLLINLEYLSSEDWTIDFHLKESLIGAKKLKKFFFFPGLNPKSGGVLVDTIKPSNEILSLEYFNSCLTSKFLEDQIVGTIFSYEHNFSNLINSLLNNTNNYTLLILGEKSQESFLYTLKEWFKLNPSCITSHINSIESIENIENIDNIDMSYSENVLNSLEHGNIFKLNNISLIFLPFFSQDEYDQLVKLVDFNFVRGEDSFVRGVLSGNPFLWEAYCQEEFVHLDKIQGYLNNFNLYFEENSICDNSYSMLTRPTTELLEEYSKIMLQYNTREVNSYLVPNTIEEFELFIKNIDDLKILNSLFSENAKVNCNLVTKLYDFIRNFLNI